MARVTSTTAAKELSYKQKTEQDAAVEQGDGLTPPIAAPTRR